METIKNILDPYFIPVLAQIIIKFYSNFPNDIDMLVKQQNYLLLEESNDFDWDDGYFTAVEIGHISIIELMIQKGCVWINNGMTVACSKGNIAVIELLIREGANDWNGGLWNACYEGHTNIIELMIKKGAKYCGNCQNEKHKLRKLSRK